MAKRTSELATISAAAQLLSLALIMAALYFARDVLIPLALALLLSFLLNPVVSRMRHWGVSNPVAVVATAALTFVLLAGGFTLLGRELTKLIGELPKHKTELISKVRSVSGFTTGVGGSLDELADEVSEAMEEEAAKKSELKEASIASKPPGTSMAQVWTDAFFPAPAADEKDRPNDGTTAKAPLYVREVQKDLPLASWATTAGTVLGPLATAGLVTVFALFMLIHREDLRDRLIAVISHGDYVTTTEAFDEAVERISRYLMAQSMINSSYGCALTIGLTIIGATMSGDGVFPNAILWGVLATCLRFVPYLGPIAAAIFPLFIAISVFPGYAVFLAVLGLIVVMELLCNNVFEPWLYGTSTGISAVAVIFAAVFWGWLWGPVGLLLSTPLTVCLVVLGRYVPRFKIFATLLGESVEIKLSIRFYQRLLANDIDHAREKLLDFAGENDLDATCDEVLVPTLKRIRADHESEHLAEADANRLFALVGGLVADVGEHFQARELENGSDSESMIESEMELPLVVGCSSHHFSEMLVLNLLRIAGAGVYQLDSVDSDMLPQQVGRQIVRLNPAVVVIAVLPKGGFAQARYLCQSIRRNGFEGPIVISCLGKFKNFDRLLVKFRKAGATYMTTTYAQTRSKIQSCIVRREPATMEKPSTEKPSSRASSIPTPAEPLSN